MQAILEQYGIALVVGSGESGDHDVLPGYEYDSTWDNDSDEFTKQCWIPATPDSKFCIHYCWNGEIESRPHKNAGLHCILYIDEPIVSNTFLPLRGIDDSSGDNREREVTGVFYEGPKGPAERPFIFKKTMISEDVDVLDESYRGTIEARITWAIPHFDEDFTYEETFTKEDVDELALNLEAPVSSEDDRLWSCIGLGDPVKVEGSDDAETHWRITDEVYTFTFHYAHPDWLKSQGIIPPTVITTYRTQGNA